MQEKKAETGSKNPKKANLLDHHSVKNILDESVSEPLRLAEWDTNNRVGFFMNGRWYIASSLHETYIEEEFWHDFARGKTENVNMLVMMRVALSSSPNYLFGIGKWNLKKLP
ncbi:hypothetical protein CCACVL1_21123 [Corchorus capsularis]|uniref:Uncharacterized protein n=1 Tax=Corchorus capsularis TaxID=210143 RepID=A0A1R3H840_COCAP|nr:hypothetical protein CCACVL1_21123 [Corchorus capsularis]